MGLAANTIEVLVTVHIRYFDQEWWETILMHRSFADTLRDPLVINRSQWRERVHTARSIVALVQAVFRNPVYRPSGASRPLDILS